MIGCAGYDLIILRRVEDSLGRASPTINAARIAQVKAFIESGGSAVLTGRMWEWNSVKKYNQPAGRDTPQNHPLNQLLGGVGIVLRSGTLHSSGVGGIGPSTGILDSNLLYILRYIATLPEAACTAPAVLARLGTVSGNIVSAIDNTEPAAIRVRVDIIGHARIRYVGKYQSCMV